MNVKIKRYDDLTRDELFHILKTRMEVFVVEQECPYQDIDDVDLRSTHVWLDNCDEIVAYLRIFLKDKDVVQIGRVLTTKRGQGFGKQVMLEGLQVIEQEYKEKEIYLESQVYAIDFYKQFGFKVCSEEFLEDGIPHVEMRKKTR